MTVKGPVGPIITLIGAVGIAAGIGLTLSGQHHNAAPQPVLLPSDTNAPTATSSAAPSSNVLQMGDTAVVGQSGAATLDVTVERARWVTRLANPYSERPANGLFAYFTVTLKNVSSTGIDVNELDFYYRGADGSHVRPFEGHAAAAVGFNSGEMQTETMRPGEVFKSTITLDVPSRHGALVYAPDDDAVAEWDF